MKEKNTKIFMGVALILAFVCIIYVSQSTSGEKVRLDTPETFNEDWSYEVNSSERILIAVHELDESMEGMTISFYTNDSFVTAYMNETVIYASGEKLPFGRSPGSLQQFILLPEDIPENSLLTIEIRTVYANKFLSSYEFLLGQSGEIAQYILCKESLNAFVNGTICLIGLLILLLYSLERNSKIKRKSNFYLGLFGIVFSIWSNCTLFFSQLLVRSALLEYYINYFALFFLPFILMMYLKEVWPGVKCYIQIYANMFLVTTMTILHFSGLRDYTETIKIFVLAQGIAMILFLVQNVKQLYFGNQKLKKLAFLILVFFIILNVGNFVLKTTFGNHSLFTKIGLVIYLGISLYLALRQTVDELVLAKENENLKNIAYTDYLTQIGNRYTFERDLKQLNWKELGFVSMDLNNLKYYNDEMGHAYGDMMLADASKILKSIYRNVYRVGGDEFVAILVGEENEQYESYIEEMQRQIYEYNQSKEHVVKLKIAAGFSKYEDGDERYESILMRADRNMYLNKAELKRN